MKEVEGGRRKESERLKRERLCLGEGKQLGGETLDEAIARLRKRKPSQPCGGKVGSPLRRQVMIADL